MRTRSRTGDRIDSGSYHWRYAGVESDRYPPNPSTPTLTGSASELVDSTVTVDVVTKDFKSRSQRGEIINNPFTKTETSYTLSRAKYVDDQGLVYNTRKKEFEPSTEYIYYGDFHPAALVSLQGAPAVDIDTVSLQDNAILQAYANVKVNEASALVTLAEGNKSIESIVSILWRVYKILKAVKKLDYKRLKGELTADELTDRYLEARYAIRPLMIDAEQIVKAFGSEQKPQRMTFRGYAEDSDRAESAYVSTKEFRSHNCRSSTLKSVTVRAGVLCEITCDTTNTGLSTWGIDQIPELAFELTPWSFVLNWFFNIGDLISAWTPRAGIKVLSSWVTVNTITHVQHSVLDGWLREEYYNATRPNRVISVGAGTYTVTTTVTQRIPNYSRPVLPQLAVNLDFFKVTDLMAFAKKLL